MTRMLAGLLAATLVASAGCQREKAPTTPKASGYVEATEVKIASKVPGRVAEVRVTEGARVAVGQVLVTIQTTDTDLAIARAQADRAQAQAQLRLLQAGTRPEDIQQAEAQLAAATADKHAADAELSAARDDEARFEQLLRNRAGSQKQRDDAVSRRQLAEARLRATDDRARGRDRDGRAAQSRRAARGDRRGEGARGGRRRADRGVRARSHGSHDHRAHRGRRDLTARRAGRARRRRHAARSSSSISITRGRMRTSRSRWCRACGSIKRRRSSPTAAIVWPGASPSSRRARSSRPATSRRRRERAKLVYRVKVTRRQPAGDSQAGHAGRGRARERRTARRTAVTGPERAVEFVDVRKSFGATKAVDGLSFDVAPRRDVRRHRPGRRGQDDEPAIDLRLARAGRRTRDDAWRRAVSRSPHGHGGHRLSVPAVQPLRRSVHRREHRVLRARSTASVISRRGATRLLELTGLVNVPHAGSPIGCPAG